MHGNIPLAIGIVSDQLKQAAKYYLDVKALNPNAHMTLTGHSLGGGLASLISVFFAEEAFTFDEAPFYATALNGATELRDYLLSEGRTEIELVGLNNFISLQQANGGVPNNDLVTNINVQGEIVSAGSYLRIGNESSIWHGTPFNVFDVGFATNLHSQALLTAFLQSEQTEPQKSLSDVTFKLTDLLPMFFDDKLFAYPVDRGNTTDENFLERLVRHEAGMGTALPADQMVTRFTADLWKLAQDGGLTMNDGNFNDADANELSKTLIAFAMQKYYEETATSAGYNEEFFENITGGIQFDLADVSAKFAAAFASNAKLELADAKGFALYFKNYLEQSAFTTSELALIQSMLPHLRDWYVQAGSNYLTATDSLNRGAFMLGGNLGDALTGGNGADLLVGNLGNDTLTGGQGNDVLLGGLGTDTYVFHSGDGLDTIVDREGHGSIKYDGVTLTGGAEYGDARVYQSADKQHLYTRVNDSTLIIDGQIVVQGFAENDLGIAFSGAPGESDPTTTRDIVGDLKPIDFDTSKSGVQTETDDIDNIKTIGADADRIDSLFDSAGNDHIASGGGIDFIKARRGGHDIIDSGTGRDWVFAGAGNDLIIGGTDGDILSGEAGDDRIYADTQMSVAAAIAAGNAGSGSGQQGDWLAGGSGNDTLVGGADNDVLSGGGGSDLLIGGAGDDDLLGDEDWVAESFNWTVTDEPTLRLFKPATGVRAPADSAADVIYAGQGNDHAWGGAGNDVIFGEAGNDKLYGGEGNDVVLGGDGTDKLDGNASNDYLDGGADQDTINGNDGDDILIGGTGNDMLTGGAGSDTYIYNKGDGKDQIDDDTLAHNIIRFGAGFDRNAIILRLGSLMLDLGNGDEIHIENFNRNDVFNSSSIDGFEFADGTVLTTKQLLARGFDLDGTDGNDEIVGTNTIDRIAGMGGDDTLFGGGDNDQLHGGNGNDQLIGDASASAMGLLHGHDLLYGDSGNDTLYGGGGNDTLYGGGDDDQLNGDSADLPDANHGNDLLFGGAGIDTLWGGGGNDTLEGGADNDLMTGDAGSDVYRFSHGWGQDVIYNNDSSSGKTDAIEFADGIAASDIQVARLGNDLILAMKGTTDIITVGDYFLSDGNGATKLEEIRFAGSVVWTIEQVKAMVLQGTEADNLLRGYAGNDFISGGGGNDSLYGQAGSDYLAGGAGNDTLYGNDGNDTLEGGAGDDFLQGVAGSDVYRFSRGWGQDSILNGESNLGARDVIEFAAGITANDIQVTRSSSGTDLVLLLKGTTDKITVRYYFTGEAVEEIHFGDGTVWSKEQVWAALFPSTDWADTLNGSSHSDLINGGSGDDALYGLAGYDSLFGGEGNDRLEGGDGNDSLLGGLGNDRLEGGADNDNLLGEAGRDTLIGGAGNDTLEGGAGNDDLQGSVGSDTYRFSRGWGQDHISDYGAGVGEADVIEFAADIAASDIVVTSSQTSLVLSLKGSTDTITIYNYFVDDGAGPWGFEEIRFAGGPIWTFNQIKAMAFQSTDGNDNLIGYATGSVISGGFGDDYLYGQAGADQLLGGDGADLLIGSAGNDTLDGGAGNDYLDGGLGNDTYLFGRGAGQDVISSWDGTVGKRDLVKLGHDIAPEDIVVAIHGDDLILSIRGTDDRLIVQRYFLDGDASRESVEAIEFANGTVWDIATVTAMQKLTAVMGGWGTQYLNGGAGNEWLDGGAGDDNITAGMGNDYLHGGDGTDYLYGGDGNDTLIGGSGNDAMQGGYGADTYYFGRGSGNDVITDQGEYEYNENDDAVLIEKQDAIIFEFGITKDDIAVSLDGQDLLLTIRDTGEILRIRTFFWIDDSGTIPGCVKNIQFSDGSSWNFKDVLGLLTPTAGGDWLIDTSGSHYLAGLAGDDSLFGALGDDTLDGGTGDDWLRGGLGNDTFVFGRGYGIDVITYTISSWDRTPGKQDVIRFADDISPDDIEVSRNRYDLTLTIRGTNDRLDVASYFGSEEEYPRIIQNIQFAGGTVWNFESVLARVGPTAGDDFLSGSAGNDVIRGLAGDDYLFGEGGNDTLEGGEGNDVLDGGAGSDTYLFGRGAGYDVISPNSGPESNNDVILLSSDVAVSDIDAKRDDLDLLLTIRGSSDQLRIERYFTEIDDSGINQSAIELIKFADESILNFAAIDALIASPTGTSSNDHLYGSSGADVIQGLEGDDEIYGEGGNDTLNGGAGNDTLIGGVGDNVYLFGRNSGSDTIRWDGEANNHDVVRFANDILVADVEVRRDQYNLLLTITDTREQLLIEGYFHSVDSSSPTRIERIQFYDGSWWDFNTVESKLTLPIATESADFLFGLSGNDVIQGLGGIDTLVGGAGNDFLDGGIGKDYLDGEDGNDTLDGGIGDDQLDGGEGNDLLIGGDGNDYLYGGDGDDTLNGGYESDLVQGGTGNDTYVVNHILNTRYMLENEDSGTDTVESSISLTLAGGFENLLLTGSAALNGTGNESDNVLIGNGAANTLVGAAGNDRLDGKDGSDVLIGGTGDDTYVVDSGSDVVTENLNEGLDTVESSVTLTLSDNLENLTLLGTSALSGTGNALNNVLIGNSAVNTLTGGAGIDRLDGGAGNDTLLGGAGDDTYVVDSISDVVTENANEGIDSVESSVTFTLGSNVESLTLTGTAAINASGNALANRLTGNAGNNRLDGVAGADTMTGGAGNDVYVVDNALDQVIELAGQGTDSVETALSYVLGVELENLTLTGTAAVNGTGNALNNVLTGNSSANRLDGGIGADSMVGGAGNDTYVVDNAGDSVSETSSAGGTDTVESGVTWTLGSNFENLTLTGLASVNATGNTLVNTLRGNAGNNRLDGGVGNDSMLGGLGDDTYAVDSTSDVVTENASEGTDTVEASVTLTLGNNIENLTLLGTSTLNGTGNTLSNILIGNSAVNTLTGGAGNDRLDGKGGADRLLGGAGDDTYVVDLTGDLITENASEGTDTVESSVTLTLGNNLENLTLTGTTVLNGTGNALNNVLMGNSAVNSLTGAAGNDRLDGQAGTDTLTGGIGNDTYIMGRGYGADTVVENDAAAGNTDVAQFLTGIANDQLWFSRASGSNNLDVSIIGTADKLTIKDWYVASANHVEQFKTSDGKTLLDSKVQNLVSAMAAFAPPTAGQTSLPSNYHAALDSVIAANWQ